MSTTSRTTPTEPRHQFYPSGYQPGHHVEWARFLALLDRYDAAVNLGWTGDGFVYTVAADGEVILPDRYGWALAEGIGAAAALAERSRVQDEDEAAARFAGWHRRLLAHAADYRGPADVWYEKLLVTADGAGDDRMDDPDERIGDRHGRACEGGEPGAPEPPGGEPDYHPVSTFYEVAVRWRVRRPPSHTGRSRTTFETSPPRPMSVIMYELIYDT